MSTLSRLEAAYERTTNVEGQTWLPGMAFIDKADLAPALAVLRAAVEWEKLEPAYSAWSQRWLDRGFGIDMKDEDEPEEMAAERRALYEREVSARKALSAAVDALLSEGE